MGLLNTIRNLCFGDSTVRHAEQSLRPSIRNPPRRAIHNSSRRCQIEALEPRQLLAADGLAPHVLLGSVYFEEASDNDSAADVIEVSFVGGAPGTTLDRLVIDGDKSGDGLSAGDVIFDTQPGGLGVFNHRPFAIVSADGFSVDTVFVEDGSSLIVFEFTGFEAGMKLRFSIDVDEVQFVDDGAVVDGVVDPSKVDVNAVVEGAEFQRSLLTGQFSAPGYVDLTLSGLHWDFFDANFAAAQSDTGQTLDLPNDVYSPNLDLSVWTAGAIAHEAQIPLATLSGWVYHDRSDDGVFDRDAEPGIGGVTLELLDASGNPTGMTTVTSNDPATLGFYEFRDLFPGTYGVREVQPSGWLDGQDTAGSHGGAAADESAGPVDRIFGAILDFGDHAVDYNFGELLPGSIHGTVQAHTGPDCDFDNPEIRLAGVRMDLLDADGSVLAFTLTDENGEYEFIGLAPGIYRVREHQPAEYYDGLERVGTAGGVASDVPGLYSLIADIQITSDLHALQYDFCEHVGVTISGNVYHDQSNDGIFDRSAANPETGIAGVVVKLLDAAGGDTGRRATTDANGFYQFDNLAAGTYAVMEIHPSGWLDGLDTAGNLGGVADASPGGDMISQIAIDWGQAGVEYNFGELLPGSIRGTVQAHTGPDCDFDSPEILLAGVRVDLLDANGDVLDFTFTDENGAYEFTGLPLGTYTVREHQPAEYYDGLERVGTAGGVASDVPGLYSLIADIQITSDLHALQYDFCEHVGVTISGNVYHDQSNDGVFDRSVETGIGGAVLKLLGADGSDTGRRATTDANGHYQFNNLAAGTYAVMEIHPAGWLDGLDTAGNLGGVADASPGGDMISQIAIDWGQAGVEYNFGELLPGSIRGTVQAHTGPDCDFDHPEIRLEGVRVDLLDANGDVLDFTFTDENGEYEFTGLPLGTYTVREHQPAEYYDGLERVGTAGGVASDVPGLYSLIADIQITSDLHAVQYDFCEHVGVVISGYVYHDQSNDGVFDRSVETGIGGAVLKLLGADGSDTGLEATTDANGHYQFNNLAAGTYAVMEIHPAGWLDGLDTAGNLGGVADASPGGDMISQIAIDWGQAGVEYNFGELLPGSIHGTVVVCVDAEGGDVAIPGVRVDLLDADGNVLDFTFTDANGQYAFTDLPLGAYSVFEHQPTDYFDDAAHVGTGGGTAPSSNLIVGIDVGSDGHLFDYDFCELPPAQLSGYVYVDGPPIPTNDPLTPEQIAALRNGQRTSDDRPLAGVTLMLRDGTSGDPIWGDAALPGTYPEGPITTVTDANGFYQFLNLPGGTYAVVQIQPDGLIDGVDTPGTLGGFAVNPRGPSVGGPSGPPIAGAAIPTPDVQQTIELFRAQFGDNAIVRIPLAAGQHSVENNFSEVEIEPVFAPPPPPQPPPPPLPPLPPLPPVSPPRPAPPVFPPPAVPFAPAFLFPPSPIPPSPSNLITGLSSAVGFTWHLSVVNAGWPRAVSPAAARFRFASAQIDVVGWQSVPLDAGRWTLAKVDYDQAQVIREEQFGNPEAVPVVGDFNGDGVSEIGLFLHGQWFIDVNGNGRWDAEDLWAQLGSVGDRPVTGDWDGDGKDDIGVFGPAWPRDPWAVTREPGLPDAANFPTHPAGTMKNMPPTDEDATSGGRVLKRSVAGTPRVDRIDHVFHYGTPGDAPVTGDWNGDGVRQIGVFRNGQWNLDTNGDGRLSEIDAAFTFGQAGDVPIVGDFNADGIDEIGVYRAGKWLLDVNNDRQLDAQDKVFELGGPGDRPVVGDWNDDGTDDPGVYHPEQVVDRVTRRAG